MIINHLMYGKRLNKFCIGLCCTARTVFRHMGPARRIGAKSRNVRASAGQNSMPSIMPGRLPFLRCLFSIFRNPRVGFRPSNVRLPREPIVEIAHQRLCVENRFIPDRLLGLFERTSWPPAVAKIAARAASKGPRIDIGARMRGIWR
jgi:hypothetical protein